MDYEKKDFRKLYEDLVKSEWFKKAYHDKSLGDCPFNIPELVESEDERMCTRCIDLLRKVSAYSEEEYLGVEIVDCIIWLQALRKKLKESLYIPETCKENADSFTDEDERIRKWLIKTIHLIGVDKDICADQETMDKAIAWLEKQKEQKPLSTEETELNALAFLSQMDYTCIPPKKEHQNNSDAPENALGGALNSPLDKDKNLDDIAQDYVEAVKEYNPEPTWNLMQTAVCYGYHYREEEEQKPVKWSEEDEEARKDAIKLLEAYYADAIEDYCPHNAETLKKMIDYLKSLRPQSKQEIYLAAKHDLAIKFMNYLDENRPEGKMGLSNAECKDIDKAFKENDWAKIMRYIDKYGKKN